MLTKAQKARYLAAIFLVFLVWTAFFGAYSGRSVAPLKSAEIDATANSGENDGGNKHQKESWWSGFFEPANVLTLVLAIATTVLACASLRQTTYLVIAANAAKRSADAAVAVELPMFVIKRVSVHRGFRTDDIELVNHGRTPAIVTGDCLCFELAKSLRTSPRYPLHAVKGRDQDTIISNGEPYQISRKKTVDDADWDRATRGETVLWAFGYIEYTDFLKQNWREGFCIGFRPARVTRTEKLYTTTPTRHMSWSRVGPPAYTYKQQQ